MPNSSLIKHWLKIRDPKAHRLFMTRSQIVEYRDFGIHGSEGTAVHT